MTDREKMIELVDDAIIAAFDKCNAYEECGSCPSYGRGFSACRSVFVADNLIANGVVVREKGEWKYYRKQGIAVCTSCSFERKVDDNFGKAVACPNCGADMRKEN